MTLFVYIEKKIVITCYNINSNLGIHTYLLLNDRTIFFISGLRRANFYFTADRQTDPR